MTPKMLILIMVTLQEGRRISVEIVPSELIWSLKVEGRCYLGVCIVMHALLCVVEQAQIGGVKRCITRIKVRIWRVYICSCSFWEKGILFLFLLQGPVLEIWHFISDIFAKLNVMNNTNRSTANLIGILNCKF